MLFGAVAGKAVRLAWRALLRSRYSIQWPWMARSSAWQTSGERHKILRTATNWVKVPSAQCTAANCPASVSLPSKSCRANALSVALQRMARRCGQPTAFGGRRTCYASTATRTSCRYWAIVLTAAVSGRASYASLWKGVPCKIDSRRISLSAEAQCQLSCFLRGTGSKLLLTSRVGLRTCTATRIRLSCTRM